MIPLILSEYRSIRDIVPYLSIGFFDIVNDIIPIAKTIMLVKIGHINIFGSGFAGLGSCQGICCFLKQGA
jgi:hypothetical protein